MFPEIWGYEHLTSGHNQLLSMTSQRLAVACPAEATQTGLLAALQILTDLGSNPSNMFLLTGCPRASP